MKIIIKKKSDEIQFEAENMVDGMKIGIIKNKLAIQGIPIKIGINMETFDGLNITIKQKDLLDLIL